MTGATKVEKSQLQTRYYVRRAESSVSDTPFFKIKSVAWGTGFVERDINNKPVVLDIPKNVSVIKGEFARNVPIKSVINGKILLRAILERGVVEVGEISEFTTAYILDDEDCVVCVLVCAPVYVTSDRSLSLEASIDIGDI